MALLTGKTRGGADWTPTFANAIDPEKCIGCGRCYKACSRNVLGPEDIEDEENYSTRMVMTIANPRQLYRLCRLWRHLSQEVLQLYHAGSLKTDRRCALPSPQNQPSPSTSTSVMLSAS